MLRGNAMIVMPKPKNHFKALRGLTRGLYPEGCLAGERKSWD